MLGTLLLWDFTIWTDDKNSYFDITLIRDDCVETAPPQDDSGILIKEPILMLLKYVESGLLP